MNATILSSRTDLLPEDIALIDGFRAILRSMRAHIDAPAWMTAA